MNGSINAVKSNASKKYNTLVKEAEEKLANQHRKANKAVGEYQDEVYKIIKDDKLRKSFMKIPIPAV